MWADFDTESRGGERGNVVAARAVNIQTNNVFNINPNMLQYGVEGPSPAPGASGDWFQFIPLGVPGNPAFISGANLYNTARNPLRDDFIRVNANDIINNQPINRPRTGNQIIISRGVHGALRNLLPGAIQWLNQRVAGGQPAAPAPQPVAPAPQPAPAIQPVRPLPAAPQKPAAKPAGRSPSTPQQAQKSVSGTCSTGTKQSRIYLFLSKWSTLLSIYQFLCKSGNN